MSNQTVYQLTMAALAGLFIFFQGCGFTELTQFDFGDQPPSQSNTAGNNSEEGNGNSGDSGGDDPVNEDAEIDFQVAANVPYETGPGQAPAGLSINGANGDNVLLGVGMSQCHDYFEHYVSNNALNGAITPVDGCQDGQGLQQINADLNGYVNGLNDRLQAAGKSPSQVTAVMAKNALKFSPEDRLEAIDDTISMYQVLIDRLWQEYPNLQAIFLNGRMYGGYGCPLNPEPYAFDHWASMKYLAETNAGVYTGVYLWTNGAEARADGRSVTAAHFLNDGCHPSDPLGRSWASSQIDEYLANVNWNGLSSLNNR